MTPTFGLLSTFPPTQCGLATFTAALQRELGAAGPRSGVVRVLDHAQGCADASVIEHMIHGSPHAVESAIAALNTFDVVIVQHEYGIYDGADGDSVIGVLKGLEVPSIVVLHTVLADPTDHQREVLEQVIGASSVGVVMTETARRRLFKCYDVGSANVVVIPHGAPAAATVPPVHGQVPLLLTWGLLGPGKGIERVIDALPAVREIEPRPHYLVLGDTHPKVLERHGERYRQSLVERAGRLGVGDMVTIRGGYLDVERLRSLIAAADVVVLPYDTREQVTSGVLIEAVAAGRPVIATAFAHARELLSTGAGLLVDHDDRHAMARAIRRVLREPGVAAAMSARATELAGDLLWSAVGDRYRTLAEQLVLRSSAVA